MVQTCPLFGMPLQITYSQGKRRRRVFLDCGYNKGKCKAYIKRHKIKYLDEDVRLYEPHIALNGGCEGYSQIDKVVIGVNNVSQLAEVIAATSDDINIYDYESMSVKEERFLNPSNWNL